MRNQSLRSLRLLEAGLESTLWRPSPKRIMPILTAVAVVALAFANGANDVSKGVARVPCSGGARWRR
jgi:phosphate/sulfate permease